MFSQPDAQHERPHMTTVTDPEAPDRFATPLAVGGHTVLFVTWLYPLPSSFLLRETDNRTLPREGSHGPGTAAIRPSTR
jgi:hypothetical protein